MASRSSQKSKEERVKLIKKNDPDYVVKQLLWLHFFLAEESEEEEDEEDPEVEVPETAENVLQLVADAHQMQTGAIHQYGSSGDSRAVAEFPRPCNPCDAAAASSVSDPLSSNTYSNSVPHTPPGYSHDAARPVSCRTHSLCCCWVRPYVLSSAGKRLHIHPIDDGKSRSLLSTRSKRNPRSRLGRSSSRSEQCSPIR